MSEGTDQHTQGVKYMVVGCYTMPITKGGKSLLPVPGQDQAEQDQPLPGVEEEVEGMEVEGEDQSLPEEDAPMDEGNEKNARHAQSMCSTWHRMVEEAQNLAAHL